MRSRPITHVYEQRSFNLKIDRNRLVAELRQH